MPRLLVALLVAASGAAQAQSGELNTIQHGEVRKGDAMLLADRLLPADVRARVVEGKVLRLGLPGLGVFYRIGYWERGRSAGRDICERTGYSLQVGTRDTIRGRALPEALLSIGKLESWREVTVLAPSQAANAGRCGAARGYIRVDAKPERDLAAYRVLASVIAAASRSGPLPFKIECTAEKTEACRDSREALATLPMEALIGIRTTCTEENKNVDDSRPPIRLISCRPIRPGQPYQAEVAFGMSGEDGQSWRVSFIHVDSWPDTIRLRRSMVTYH